MRNRRDPIRGKMVNYANVLVAALSVTSLVLLIKYRNLTTLMAEEEMSHMTNQRLLLDDLGSETDRNKILTDEMNKRIQEIKTAEDKLKGVQNELTNSVNALQASNDQIEVLKIEKLALNDEFEKVKSEKDDLQINMAALQDDLQKTRVMADDQSATIRDSQDKQEKLLGENTKLSQQIESYKSLQGENENLKRQIQIVQNSAKLSEDRIHELEAQLKQKREAENNAPPPEVKEIAEAGQDLIQKNLPDSGGANPDSKNIVPEPLEAPKGKNPDYLDKEIPKENVNDGEKSQLEQELQENEVPDGEAEDEREEPEGDEGVLPDADEGRQLDNAAEEDDDNNGNAQEDKIVYPDAEDEKKDEVAEAGGELEGAAEGGNEPESAAEGGLEPEGAAEGDGGEDNNLAAPKAFEESARDGGSFDMPGKRNLLSWSMESTDQEDESL